MFVRASTTSAVLSTLDDKLGQLAQQAAASLSAKESYDKQYQANVVEVQTKQKEPPKPPAPRPPNALKSGPTAAGLALLAKKEEAERLKAEQAQVGDSNMEVDDERGKSRR